MLFASDDDDFPIKCPGCKNEFHEKIGRLKAETEIRCPDPACQIRIGIPHEQFFRALEEARKSPRDFYRQFVRLRVPD